MGDFMLSNELELTLRNALAIATQYKHEYATYEHLLLSLTEDKDVKLFMQKSSIDIELLKSKLRNYLEYDFADLVDNNVKESKPTAGFQRIIQRAALHNQANGEKIITGVHVLAEFYFESDAYALLCLKDANLHRKDILDWIKNKKTNKKPTTKEQLQITLLESAMQENSNNLFYRKVNYENSSQNQEGQEELSKYCVNLNHQANTNSIDCLIGRHNEIQRTIEILCRRKKNNAILVGEPGVGKTAIAEGLATRIVKGDVPDILKNIVIYALDIGSLVAGTKFRGDFEERIKTLLEGLKKNKNAVLFIDEIHTIIGAGSTTTGAMDASNLLKPALAKGELRCIGSTTFKEYHNHFEKDMALVRRFQKVVVAEPDEEATLEILQGLKGYYEKHHNVKYNDEALKAAISLSKRYIHDRHLPDKAIDLMDESGARSKMYSNKKTTIITEKDIEELVSNVANIPSIRVVSSDLMLLKNLNSNLKSCIFGQNKAIDDLCSSIKLAKAGLKKGNRPTGCYVFAGPTGVGKTELAKQLANFCNMKLIKFDMSEFSESSSVSKLLGSAPGYVGFDQGGKLSDEVDKYPYSVVLFDEIEKAHGEIYNLLLQIMDEGVITDSTGKKVNFAHTMIILTTNIIAEKGKSEIGFNKSDADIPINMDAINEKFSPEFRSRLDNIILFNPINNIVDKIVNKNIKELASQLADKKVKLEVSSSVKKYLIKNCFDNKNGARELDRMFDNKIKQNLADEMLFGKLKNGGTVSIDICKKNNDLIFTIKSVKDSDKNEIEVNN